MLLWPICNLNFDDKNILILIIISILVDKSFIYIIYFNNICITEILPFVLVLRNQDKSDSKISLHRLQIQYVDLLKPVKWILFEIKVIFNVRLLIKIEKPN